MKTEEQDPAGAATNTRTVARNAFWFGLESIFNLLAVVLITVAVARVIGKDDPGKDRLGYYNYVVWLTLISVAIGSVGLSATTRKYMAEYLNRGQAGVARATYLSTLKLQTYISLGVAAVSMAILLWLGHPGFFLASALLVAAMVPRLVQTIPSQANNASEVLQRNTGPALAGSTITTGLQLACLLAAYLCAHSVPAIAAHNWDLIGLSIAVFLGAAFECVWKLQSVEKWLGGVPRATLDPHLLKRMFAYSGQGLALLALNIVVWDRSDIIILQWLNHDAKQLLFFSVPFSLAERILLIPGILNQSLGATMAAQYGRDQTRLKEMTVDGARYALLLALPLLLGMACVSGPMVVLVYGKTYQPMVAVLAIVALLAIPKSLIQPPTMLLQVEERQVFLIVWGCLCGVVDLGLDVLLVGQYGAKGAAIANGTAQALAALGIWIYVWRTNRLDLKLLDFGRILLSGALMSAAVLEWLHLFPGYAGMFGAILLGALVWLVAVRLTGALKPQDAERFVSIGRSLPYRFRPHWKRLIDWLAPASAA